MPSTPLTASIPSFRLDGKTAIVTGGTRGIGRAIAQAFAAAGARVVVGSENAEACAATEHALRDEGFDVLGVECDVTSNEQQQAMIDRTVATYGGLDILVANAGITGNPGGTTEASAEEYERVMATNLTSVVRLCGMAIPYLTAQGGGSIVLMSSISGIRGNKAIGPYALTKAALMQLARNLTVEHGPKNIRANAIAPGLIRTELSLPLLNEQQFMERRMAMTPLRRVGEPVEVAGAALFLVSPAGAFVAGQTLVVDGGTVITDGN